MPPIVVIAGQSNAAGRGTIPLLPGACVTLGYGDPLPAVQFMYRVEDTPTDPLEWDFDEAAGDLDYIHSGNGTYGIELSLGRRLHQAGYEHAIVKMAIGSSSLAVHWDATSGAYPAGPADPLFTQFLDYCTSAETDLSGTIAELIWIQGETDAGNQAHANAYAANFAAFMTAFRAEFPGVPVTLNRLHSGSGGTYNSVIRAQQSTIVATVPGVRIFNVDDLALDGAHFTSAAFITLGERFADAILGRRPGVGVRVGMGLP